MEQREGALLRIFISENDRQAHMPLYEWILKEAGIQGIAGATVLRGMAGFGANHTMHTAKILRLSQDLPVVVEIVDTAEKVGQFKNYISGFLTEGLMTVEKVTITSFKPRVPV